MLAGIVEHLTRLSCDKNVVQVLEALPAEVESAATLSECARSYQEPRVRAVSIAHHAVRSKFGTLIAQQEHTVNS